MKKDNNKTSITLSLLIDNQLVPISFKYNDLRNWFNNLTIQPDQDTVDFEFSYNSKDYCQKFTIQHDLPVIERALRFAELSHNIIPKNLSHYLTDITQKLSYKKVSRVIGREHEIEKAWFYLSQKQRNNVFLIGEKDVGKTAIAKELARRIALNKCPKDFYDKRVLMLKPEILLKINNKYLYEHIINQLINFLVKNKNHIILFVDKAINMKTDLYLIYLLYACLKKYNIPLIVTSSEDNFEDYFYNDQSISKYINYIYIEEPELNEVEPMVKPYIKKLEREYDIKISKKMIKYAIFTSDLLDSISVNPGRLINIFERAFLDAKRKGKKEIDKTCILNCYDTHVKKYEKMPEEEKKATAYHETGHYILAITSKYRKDIKISCVSNLPMSYWAGVTMSYYDIEEYSVNSKEYFLDYIAMLLAGRIAEKKFTNLNSTGASNDLMVANSIAKAMIMNWGFSEKPTNLNRHYTPSDYYLMPESKKSVIDDEVQELIDEGTKRATVIIEENEDLLKIIAEKLLVEELLTGEELELIYNEYKNSSKKGS